MRSIQEIQLSAIFKQFKVADFAYAILGDLTLQDLLNLALSKNKQVAFRASWLLETIVLKEKIHLNKIHKELILQLPIQYNWSCLRSYTKVCMQLTSRLEKDITLTAVEEEILINCCFTYLSSAACPVAVTVNAMDVLYNLRTGHPWIQEELLEQIDFLLKKPSPALLSRAKKIQLKLKNNKRGT